MAQDKLRKDASSKRLQPDTLEFAQYVILFTTFSEAAASDVLVPHPPAARLTQVPGAISYDDESAKAWLYGKLLAALLVEKLIHPAVSPWGCEMETSAWRDFGFMRSHARSSLVSPSRSRNGMRSRNRWLNHGVAGCLTAISPTKTS